MRVVDQYSDFSGGCNGQVNPFGNTLNEYRMGVNVRCRGGQLRTRPPVAEYELTSETPGEVDWIQHMKFQGGLVYRYQGTTYQAFGIAGRVYLFDPIARTIHDMTAVPGPFSQFVDRLYFCQVDRYLVVQDGINLALIIEGLASRKAVPGNDEVPTGTIMAYGHGRLFIKTGMNEFVAGDIQDTAIPTQVLQFTETQYWSGGGAFFVPMWMGEITGMIMLPQFGTPTAQGPLAVYCEHGTATFNVYLNRIPDPLATPPVPSDWQTQPMIAIQPWGLGNASHSTLAVLNEDIFWMGWSGIQSFGLVSSDTKETHRLTTLDQEMLPVNLMETSWMRRYASMAVFDGRLLYTAVGDMQDIEDSYGEPIRDYRFRSIVALDFAVENGLRTVGRSVRPAFDGVWTGMNPLWIMSGVFSEEERCFVWGRDDDGVLHLYELLKGGGHDLGAIRIPCRVYGRQMGFVIAGPQGPVQADHMRKRLSSAFLWLPEFRGDISIALAARSDLDTGWRPISQLTLSAPETGGADVGFAAAREHSAIPLKLPSLDETQGNGSRVTGKLAVQGHVFSLRLDWTGDAALSRITMLAEADDDDTFEGCDFSDGTAIIEAADDWFAYKIH